MLNIQTGSGVGLMSDKEDIFGTIPDPVDESIPTWHIPPSVTIPSDRRELNEPNAAILLYHPSPSIRIQAKELLDGVGGLKRPAYGKLTEEHMANVLSAEALLSQDKAYRDHMDKFDSSEDYFNNNKKG